MSATLLPVPFRGRTLYVFDHDQQPHTPMKPIVEGLGLAWQVQYRKLLSRIERWGITIMVIQAPGDGQARRTLVMPVRKLAGWLMTIHPGKVKPELRETLLAYQRECDEVLWQYWRERYDAAAAAELEDDPTPTGFTAEVPVIQRPDHNLLREYRLISPSLAQAYLVECGVTPDYVSRVLADMPALPGAQLSVHVVPPAELVARLARATVTHDHECWYILPHEWRIICNGYSRKETLRWLLLEGYLKHNTGRLTYRPSAEIGGAKRTLLYAVRKSLQEVRHG